MPTSDKIAADLTNMMEREGKGTVQSAMKASMRLAVRSFKGLIAALKGADEEGPTIADLNASLQDILKALAGEDAPTAGEEAQAVAAEAAESAESARAAAGGTPASPDLDALKSSFIAERFSGEDAASAAELIDDLAARHGEQPLAAALSALQGGGWGMPRGAKDKTAIVIDMGTDAEALCAEKLLQMADVDYALNGSQIVIDDGRAAVEKAVSGKLDIAAEKAVEDLRRAPDGLASWIGREGVRTVSLTSLTGSQADAVAAGRASQAAAKGKGVKATWDDPAKRNARRVNEIGMKQRTLKARMEQDRELGTRAAEDLAKGASKLMEKTHLR